MRTKQFILLLIALMLCMGLFAQAADSVAANKTSSDVTIFTVIQDSGKWGWAIIAVFIIGLAYAFVRYHQLYVKEKIDAGKLYLKLKGYIKNEQIDEAVKITESFKGTTLGFIFWSFLVGYRETKKQGITGKMLRDSGQNAYDEASLQMVHKLDSGLWWFDLIAQILTYLGLLGTIWGLLVAFAALANAAPAEKGIKLTNGIKVAIGTTALGLITAIIITLIKGALMTRAQRLLSDVDEYGVKLVNQVNFLIKD